MANANPRWGALRIHGELLKLGIDVCQAAIVKYMMRQRQSTADLAHFPAESHRPDRGGRCFPGPDRDLPPLVRPGALRLRSATHPARGGHRASDGGQQLREQFSWDEVPRYLVHDRDHAFDSLRATAKAMGSTKCSRHRARLGKIHSSSDLLDPLVVNVSIK
jgi:hypothetical protein